MTPAPSPFLCGVIEGFYGRPWTPAQRGQLAARMEGWGLNAYLYAPKDDLKHRHFWRELYTREQAAELRELIENCRSRQIRFIYAIAPGLDPLHRTQDGEDALDRKAAQLLDLGCSSFALLFDDIVAMPNEGGLAVSAADARDQAAFTNRFFESLSRQVPEPGLLFCPTQYCGRMAGEVSRSSYLTALGEQLQPAIHVFWTGPEIVSQTISVESIRAVQSVLRRKPLLWDNLHANDYDLRRIYLGPYAGRSMELREEMAGVLSNPNCEFELNFVPLRTLALWREANPTCWNPQEAYRAALQEWQPEWRLYSPSKVNATLVPTEDLESLCDVFHLPFEHGPAGAELLRDLHFLLRTPPGQWEASEVRFAQRCAWFQRLFDELMRLENRELLHALYRHLWELKEELILLSHYLHWRQTRLAFHEPFRSPEHQRGTYRGGLVADLQRLLPMNDEGQFNSPP